MLSDYQCDSVLTALLRVWLAETRPPECLIDLCLEWGLEGQADGVRWSLEVPDRPLYGNRDRLGGPVPTREDDTVEEPYWYWLFHRWWLLPDYEADFLPIQLRVPMRGGEEERYPSGEEALIDLLDGFAALSPTEREGLFPWRAATAADSPSPTL